MALFAHHHKGSLFGLVKLLSCVLECKLTSCGLTSAQLVLESAATRGKGRQLDHDSRLYLKSSTLRANLDGIGVHFLCGHVFIGQHSFGLGINTEAAAEQA